MWASDIAVVCIALALLLSEARGMSRQGCAHALVRVLLGRGRGAGAGSGAAGRPAPTAAQVSTGSASETPLAEPSASASVAISASVAGDAVMGVLDTGQGGGHIPSSEPELTSRPPPAVVSAFASASPSYSLRWLAADAAVALALMLAQVVFIGLL